MPRQDKLAAGTELSHYRLLRLLGSGGMADVYEAEDTMLGRQVALKLLPPEFSRDANLRARFEREVKQCAALNHRNIVTLFDFGYAEPYHFYTMQLLAGGDLASRIERGLSETEACRIMRELAGAFAYAHRKQLIHRDVKPENVVFDEHENPVLTDFGIAKAMDSATRMTKTGMSVGTPCYISPEQARGKKVDGRSDLYSLGVIFFEMLSGKVPFQAADAMATIMLHMTEPVPALPADRARFQPIVEKLLAKDPEKRYPDASAVIRDLDAVMAQGAAAAPEPEPEPERDTGDEPTVMMSAEELRNPGRPRRTAAQRAASRPKVRLEDKIEVPRRQASPPKSDRQSARRGRYAKIGGGLALLGAALALFWAFWP